MATTYSCDLCGAPHITPIPVVVTELHPHDSAATPSKIDLCTPCAQASRLESPRSLDELKRTRNEPPATS